MANSNSNDHYAFRRVTSLKIKNKWLAIQKEIITGSLGGKKFFTGEECKALVIQEFADYAVDLSISSGRPLKLIRSLMAQQGIDLPPLKKVRS